MIIHYLLGGGKYLKIIMVQKESFCHQANNQIPNNSLAQYMNVLFNNEEITMRPWLDQLSNSSNTTYYGHDIIYQERADMQNSNVSLNFSIKEFSLNPSSYKLVAYFNVMDTQNNWNQVQYEEVIVTSSGNYSLSINTLPQKTTDMYINSGLSLEAHGYKMFLLMVVEQ